MERLWISAPLKTKTVTLDVTTSKYNYNSRYNPSNHHLCNRAVKRVIARSVDTIKVD
jgi:hypothetical protein